MIVTKIDNDGDSKDLSKISILTTTTVRLVQLEKQQRASREAEKVEVSKNWLLATLNLPWVGVPDIAIQFECVQADKLREWRFSKTNYREK